MKKTLFAGFEKVEVQDDGTVKVFGIASSEARDHDGELIRAEAIKKALPDYLVFGNVREMHQPIAAGVAIDARVDDDGVTHFGAHIVDDQTVKKIRAGVLKGFSIGGKVTKRNKTDKSIIEAITLTEISVVDRPSNPDAVITLAKFDSAGRVTKVPQATGDDVIAKSLWDVKTLAGLLTELCYLYNSVAYEAAAEQDGSSIPARVKTSVEGLVAVLRDMVDEETREMLGGMTDVALMGKAIESLDLQKAGRRFSATTVKSLSTLHGAIKQACETLDSLGYAAADNPEDQEMNDSEKAAFAAAQADAIQKAVAAEVEKTVAPIKAKADTMEKSVADLTAANADLTAKLAAAEAGRVTAEKTATDLADEVTKRGIVRQVPPTAIAKGADIPAPAAAAVPADAKPDFNAELRKSFASPKSPIRGMEVVSK